MRQESETNIIMIMMLSTGFYEYYSLRKVALCTIFLPRDAMHSAILAVVRRLSVCLSVTLVHCIEMAWVNIWTNFNFIRVFSTLF